MVMDFDELLSKGGGFMVLRHAICCALFVVFSSLISKLCLAEFYAKLSSPWYLFEQISIA
jgi:hypothetical protein